MQAARFITITGIDHYYGKKPFEVGRVFKIIKEPDNEYDDEAICAFLPFIEKIGYVANSTRTVYQGTVSAGRLYDKIDDYAYAKAMFITHSSVIALVLDKDDVENADKNISEDKIEIAMTDKENFLKDDNVKVPIGFKI